MINKPTCYKNPDKPTCIDLILTNCLGTFQNSYVIETGLSDFHKMIVTLMKTYYRKIEPRVLNYRDYKSSSNEGFRELLHENLKGKLSGNSDQSFSNFINTCNTVLDKQLPKKKKYVRGNQSPFMNKTLSKVIMLRTNLKNKFLKNRSNENKTNYVKQRNHCASLLRKTKREYYSNSDEKKICDNKTFWKIIKPMLSKKIKSNERITLIENDEIIKTEKGTAKVLNAFFSNIVQNLDIQQYNNSENINDPLLKAIVRYRNHPRIVAIKKFCNSKSHFSFKHVQKEEILTELNNLNIN